MDQQEKTLATRRSVNDDPSITVQDFVHRYERPPEAIAAISLVASTYFQFLAGGFNFVSPSMAVCKRHSGRLLTLDEGT